MYVSMLQEAEKPKPDSLYGLRVHAWVLVLSGKREVPESFFIDPFTAKSYSTTDGHFLGIEALWNHVNYWVNMQSCLNGCKVTVLFEWLLHCRRAAIRHGSWEKGRPICSPAFHWPFSSLVTLALGPEAAKKTELHPCSEP